MKDDDVGVVIVRHDDDRDGEIASRRLFTDLNRWAKATTQSENITIDEDDGLAIVTRRLVRDHDLLRDRVWYRSRQLPPTSEDSGIKASKCFTTLESIYNCNETIARTKRGEITRDWKRVRPEPNELDQLYEECKEFWDGLTEIPELRQVAQNDKNPEDFRPNTEGLRGEGHLLFRPIGQEMMALAISRVLSDTASELDDIGRICRLCSGVNWRLDAPPWRGLFFGEGGRMLGSRNRQVVGANLLRYMLDVPWPDQDGLLQDYRKVVYPADPESDEALQLNLPPKVV